MAVESPAEKYSIVDTDAHYLTAFDELAEYLDESDPWRTRLQRTSEGGIGNLTMFPKSSITRDSFWRDSYDSLRNREDVRETMADIGVDDCVLLADKMLVFGLIRTKNARPTVYANAYTDYMLDRVVDPDAGIHMSVPVPYHNVDDAVELIDRVGDERGVVGLCMVCGHAEPPFGNRQYDPIYEAAERHDLPIMFHGGDAIGDDFYMSGFSNYLETHTLGFVWDNMAQLTSLVVQGVPEKFPDLDFLFQEAGIFWVPSLMYRLDSEYMRHKTLAPLLEKRPSEYMKEFYYGTQPLDLPSDPAYFEYVIEMLGGPERLVYASDHPHSDYDDPASITDMNFLTDDEKAAILGGTAREVFDL